MPEKPLRLAAGAMLAILPAAVYLGFCANPETAPKAAINGLSALGAVFVAAEALKRGEDVRMAKLAAKARWTALGLLLTAMAVVHFAAQPR